MQDPPNPAPLKEDTPARLAKHSLKYVLLSAPQTASNSLVQEACERANAREIRAKVENIKMCV